MPADPHKLRALTSVARQSATQTEAPLGLRDRHKIEKLQRISSAAIMLFGRDGFEGATLRDIAREADVALGTLSLYARDKRDLVMLVFNTLIPPLFRDGRRSVNRTASLADNMIALYRPCYEAYAANATLYRTVLGQVYNGANSVHGEENDAIRIEVLSYMGDIIHHAIATGECRADTDINTQARVFFYVYFTAVRVWLFQDHLDPDQGLTSLHHYFTTAMLGCSRRD